MKILKSEIAGIPEFAVKVADHAKQMRDWRAHMDRVKLDEANDVTGIDKHHAYGRPVAHPLVEAAVDENGEANFEVIDDPIPEAPPKSLETKKAELLRAVSIAEQAAVATIVPLGKRRLFNMRESDIGARHTVAINDWREKRMQAQADAVAQASLIDKVKSALTGSPQKGIEVPAPVKSGDDAQFLKDQEDRRAKIQAIEHAAAQAHHDIEDLTDETVDSWKLPDLTS